MTSAIRFLAKPGQAKPRQASLITITADQCARNPRLCIFVPTTNRRIDCSTPLQVTHARGVLKGSILLSRTFFCLFLVVAFYKDKYKLIFNLLYHLLFVAEVDPLLEMVLPCHSLDILQAAHLLWSNKCIHCYCPTVQYILFSPDCA